MKKISIKYYKIKIKELADITIILNHLLAGTTVYKKMCCSINTCIYIFCKYMQISSYFTHTQKYMSK